MSRHTPIETDDIIYRLLANNTEVNAAVGGRIYPAGDRPLNSTTADIVVNTIALDTNMPQTGTSNVNIHVPDEKATIGGQQQYHTARETLRTLTALVVSAIETTAIKGLSLRISNQAVLAEESIHQHYMNIRVEWNIQFDADDVEPEPEPEPATQETEPEQTSEDDGEGQEETEQETSTE